eukprot:2597682-Pleurochrysis_carterae.AAC.1
MFHLLSTGRITASSPEQHVLADATSFPIVALKVPVVDAQEHAVLADRELVQVREREVHVVACLGVACGAGNRMHGQQQSQVAKNSRD